MSVEAQPGAAGTRPRGPVSRGALLRYRVLALTTAIRMVFMFLGMIPILGILFQIADMLIAMVLALFIMVFLSGLSVTYLQDEEER